MMPPPERATPPAGDLVALEQRLDQLRQGVADLQSRVARLEGMAPPEDAAPQAPEPASADGESGTYLGLVGRACLLFGGAFLIRAITDAGTLPHLLGVLTGLIYAGFWAWRGDQEAGRSRPLAASVYTLSAAAIAYPLLWEATTRFHVLASGPASVTLVLITSGLMFVAWRRDLPGVAWTVLLAALATGLALLIATTAVMAMGAVFLLFGTATLWLTGDGRWQGLRWPAALAADGVILLMTQLATWPGGPPEAYRTLSAPSVQRLALALALIYLGGFTLRALRQSGRPGAFEVLQTLAVLGVGFGGALRLREASGGSSAGLGAGALLGGLGCYAMAYAWLERRERSTGHLPYLTTLALVLVLAGSGLLLERGALLACLLALGLVGTLLGARYQRTPLQVHGVLCLCAATLLAGLPHFAVRTLFAPAHLGTTHLGPGGLAVLGALVLAHLALQSPDPARGWTRRLPSLVVGTLAVFGLGALVVAAAVRLLAGEVPEAGTLAVIRTAVLSLSALLLGLLGRLLPTAELTWLVYPILGLTGLKLVVEDLAVGRPLTLFLAFTVFGAALILAPRLRRKAPPPAPAG
jgi:hypothetical protein